MANVLNIDLYIPHERQELVHEDNSRFKVLNWGRRTGKSVFVVNYTLLKAIEAPGRYWIVAPTYKQAKNIYWYDIVLHHVPRELIAKKNESELIITLINGATIELKGADNEDSLRGAGVQGLVLDEYAFMKPHVWDLILRPMLADSKGWAVFISTPNGYNHFYDIATTAMDSTRTDWFYSHATSYDNPHVDNSEIDSIKENMNDNQFAQEYLAEFRKMQGLVYPQFERDTHVVTPSEVPTEGTHYFTMDFGFSNPTAVLFCTVDYDNNLYIWDEVYKAGMVTEQIANAIKSKIGDKQYRYRLGDGAAAQEIANLNAAPYTMGIEAADKGKDSIRTGIRLITDRMKIQGNGKPRLFISEVCKNLIWELETYRYPDKKEDHNESEEPLKENDHACFVAGTLILTPTGTTAIELLRTGDDILTPFGIEQVVEAQLMGGQQVVDYGIFTSTSNHPVLTSRGMTPVDALQYNSLIWKNNGQKQFTIMEYLIAGTLTRESAVRDFIFAGLLTRSLEAKLATCTGILGKQRMAQSLTGILSIIKTVTTTTQSEVLNVLHTKNMLQDITGESTKDIKNTLVVLDILQRSGTLQKQGNNGTPSMRYKTGVSANRHWLDVLSAVESTIRTSLVEAGSVLAPAEPRGVEGVYNLATPSGMYFANGVLVSNCDALRYLVLKLEHNVRPLQIYKPKAMLQRKYHQ